MGAIGGMNYNGSGSMSGTDATATPPTTTQSQSLNHTTAAGGLLTEVQIIEEAASICRQQTLLGGTNPTTAGCKYYVALETGAIDPGQATASFSGLSTIPMGTGTSFLKETWSVPLALEAGVPALALGIKIPGLQFLVHGGFDFDRWKAGFNLIELGAPGGLPTSASKTSWSADPAVGVGARYYLSSNWFAGVDSTWAFARSQNISAPSANFAPLQSYTLDTGSHTVTTVMFELGYSFGGPPPPSAPMVTKAR